MRMKKPDAGAPLPGAGGWMMIIGALGALIASLVEYFWSLGIAGTWGALGVIGGAFVILLVSLWLGFSLRRPVWFRAIITLLLLAAILGEGFCAWLLETIALQALTALVLLGWLVMLVGRFVSVPAPGSRRSPA